MYVVGPEVYDAIYHFKDYAREAARLAEIIERNRPGAHTILDVACGTGQHARYLGERYAVDGIDIEPTYIEAARRRNPAGDFSCADMTDFDLGRTYDVITCLFSAIGHLKTIDLVERAFRCFKRHLKSGGLAIVEPWITPDQWQPGGVFLHTGEFGTSKVCRMSVGGREVALSTLDFHYLLGSAGGIEHRSERLELGLFTREETTRALESAGFEVTYDAEGLMGRGLYIARARD